MQTFMPCNDFRKSLESLDNKRLGKQRVEAMQIFNVLNNPAKKGWRNHPAVKMWIGYEDALKLYQDTAIRVWVERGFRNTMHFLSNNDSPKMPWWMGKEDFHKSMRSRLIVKDREFYIQKFPNDEGFNGGKYMWPVNETQTFKII